MGSKNTTRSWGGHHLVDTNHNLLATEHIHDPFLCEVQSAPRPFAHRWLRRWQTARAHFRLLGAPFWYGCPKFPQFSQENDDQWWSFMIIHDHSWDCGPNVQCRSDKLGPGTLCSLKSTMLTNCQTVGTNLFPPKDPSFLVASIAPHKVIPPKQYQT